jgi:hypothetical protein
MQKYPEKISKVKKVKETKFKERGEKKRKILLK